MDEEAADLDALGDAIVSVAALIEHFDGDGVIIGGVAVGLLTTPRFTADVDATLPQRDRDLDQLVGSPEKFGLEHRSANPVAIARRTRMMLLKHKNSGVPSMSHWVRFHLRCRWSNNRS